MEGPKRSNWADDSEEEWSEEESAPKTEAAPQQQKPLTEAPPQPVKSLSSQIESSKPPYCFKFCNISFDCKSENDLWSFFGITEEEKDEVYLVMARDEKNRFRGNARAKTSNKEIALKIAEKDRKTLRGRDISIYLREENGEGGQGRGRGRRGDRRGSRRGTGRGRYPQSQRNRYDNEAYEPKIEEKPKERPKIINSSKIVIAASGDQPQKVEEEKLPPPPPPKPKSNPFGNAKPIDTLAKELEFEKKRQLEAEEKKKEVELEQEEPAKEQENSQVEEEKPAEVEVKAEPKEIVKEAQERPQRYTKKQPRKEYEPTKTEEKAEDATKAKKTRAWGNDEESKKILASAPPPAEVKAKAETSYTHARYDKSGGKQGKYRVKQPKTQESANE
ncbi:unnamed protein product [Blepharisma stoltei]|uniref:RRM domain-containing protein n=1 Tax=Blepharisma stoltei TaxID=1481888 RepID=A0AAU9IN71_9CILI|nr:unnamed protein product [Blepharisma stoltei]